MASGQHGALSFQDTKDMRVLVTGASGFVGRGLLVTLRDRSHEVIAASRSRVEQPGIFYVRSPELGPEADWVNNTFAEGDLLAGIRKPHETFLVK